MYTYSLHIVENFLRSMFCVQSGITDTEKLKCVLRMCSHINNINVFLYSDTALRSKSIPKNLVTKIIYFSTKLYKNLIVKLPSISMGMK